MDRYSYGQQNDDDPDWLLDNASVDDIREWLKDIKDYIESAKQNRMANKLDEWSLRFVGSMESELELKIESGFEEYPLTGRQLVHLKRIWHKVGAVTIQHVKDMSQQRSTRGGGW